MKGKKRCGGQPPGLDSNERGCPVTGVGQDHAELGEASAPVPSNTRLHDSLRHPTVNWRCKSLAPAKFRAKATYWIGISTKAVDAVT